MFWNHPSVLGVMPAVAAAVMEAVMEAVAAVVDVTRAGVTAVVNVANVVASSVTLRPFHGHDMDSKQENDPGFKLGQ